jgi:hypothetical protein
MSSCQAVHSKTGRRTAARTTGSWRHESAAACPRCRTGSRHAIRRGRSLLAGPQRHDVARIGRRRLRWPRSITSCGRRPRAVGVRGDADQMTLADAVLDYDQRVDAAQWPSLTNSPCTRRRPHVGFSVAMRLTRMCPDLRMRSRRFSSLRDVSRGDVPPMCPSGRNGVRGLQSPVHGFDSRLRLRMFVGLRATFTNPCYPPGDDPPDPRLRAAPANLGYWAGNPVLCK